MVKHVNTLIVFCFSLCFFFCLFFIFFGGGLFSKSNLPWHQAKFTFIVKLISLFLKFLNLIYARTHTHTHTHTYIYIYIYIYIYCLKRIYILNKITCGNNLYQLNLHLLFSLHFPPILFILLFLFFFFLFFLPGSYFVNFFINILLFIFFSQVRDICCCFFQNDYFSFLSPDFSFLFHYFSLLSFCIYFFPSFLPYFLPSIFLILCRISYFFLTEHLTYRNGYKVDYENITNAFESHKEHHTYGFRPQLSRAL